MKTRIYATPAVKGLKGLNTKSKSIADMLVVCNRQTYSLILLILTNGGLRLHLLLDLH